MENATDKDDDYEIMPHREIIELKRELERIKKNPLGKNKTAEDLLEAVNNLDHSINRLIEVFEHAADKLKEESAPAISSKGTPVQQQGDVKPLINKIDQLIDQNKEIAEGIISVAQMIKRERKEVRNFEEQVKPALRRPEPRPYNPEPRPFPSLMPTAEPRPAPSFNPTPIQSFNPTPAPSPSPSFAPTPATNPMPNYPRPTFPDMSVPSPQPQQPSGGFDFNMPPPPKIPESGSGEKKKGFLF